MLGLWLLQSTTLPSRRLFSSEPYVVSPLPTHTPAPVIPGADGRQPESHREKPRHPATHQQRESTEAPTHIPNRACEWSRAPKFWQCCPNSPEAKTPNRVQISSDAISSETDQTPTISTQDRYQSSAKPVVANITHNSQKLKRCSRTRIYKSKNQ